MRERRVGSLATRAGALCVALGVEAVITSPAWADHTPREHLPGFFLRLSAGGGGSKSTLDLSSGDMKVSGAMADLNLAVGGVITPNLALHGTLFGWAMSDPEVEIEGLGSAGTSADFSLGAFGAGLTYYFMPVNMYLSASAGAGSLHVDAGNIEGDSDTGLALDFTLGKEWWVGNSWGLGAALGLVYHSIGNGGDIDENWQGTSLALRFTATYN